MKPERASAVILGTLLFVLLGVVSGLFTAPVPQPGAAAAALAQAGAAAAGISYLMVLGLLLAGWRAGFPRWSYPYLGYALIFPLFLSHASTPGLTLFGQPLWGTQGWGWRAFVPLGLTLLLGLAVNRPRRDSLMRLVRNAWGDWTLVAFALFGLMPLVVFISLDEVAHTFAFWPQLAGSLFVIAGALLYMRLTRPGLRYLALLAGAFAAVAVMSAGTSYYWSFHDVDVATGVVSLKIAAVDWPALFTTALTQAGVLALVLLVPLPAAWVLGRRFYVSPTPTGA